MTLKLANPDVKEEDFKEALATTRKSFEDIVSSMIDQLDSTFDKFKTSCKHLAFSEVFPDDKSTCLYHIHNGNDECLGMCIGEQCPLLNDII